jgi:hypothetical protein
MEGEMYQAIGWAAYQQWVEELDRKAALKQDLPRRERERRFRPGLTRGRAAEAD